MKEIISYIKDINGCYLILNLLLLICFNLYLRSKKIAILRKRIILGIAILISVIGFFYLNGLVQSIFQLKYLSMKSYLLIVAITNFIVLFTINKKVKLGYSIANYTLFILMMIIFGSTLAVVLGNQFEELYVMDISNAVTLIDLSFVIFMLYLIVISLIYIGYYLFSNYSADEMKEIIYTDTEKILEKVKHSKAKEVIEKKEAKKLKPKVSFWKRRKDKKSGILTSEELLNSVDKHNFYINGVECSIIFEDSNQENIIKNYHILLNDIHAKLVNGFTLEENQLLKSICTKLQVSNLNYIDLNNVSILNRVSIEEYNFLKKIMGAS